MTRTYTELKLHRSAPWKPDWSPGDGVSRDQYAYAAPDYVITRADGDVAYLVQHVATGEQCEVPVASARSAVVAPPKPEPKPAAAVQLPKGARR